MASIPSRTSTLTESAAELIEKALGGKIDLQSEAIQDKFKEAIQSRAVQDTTVHAIKELNSTVHCIRQDFRRIRQDLQSFDNAGYRGKDGDVLQLSPEWDKMHEHFHEILDTSRDNATEAAAFMRQFTVAMLQDVDECDYATLRDELANFTMTLAKKEQNARKAKKDFSQLADDVYLFANRIDLVIEEADAHIREEIHATQHRIADLHVRLEQVSSDTNKMAAACLASLATTALGVGLVIMTLSPDAFVLAITSAAALGHATSQLVKLRREKKDIKQELKTCTENMMQLTDRQDTLCRYKASLAGTQSDIKELSSKISTFANIWQSLKADLHSFNEQLGQSVNPNARITKIFQKKIASTRELYNTLIFLLEQYAKGSVDKEDEKTLCDSDVDDETKMKSEA
ncbi:hypothetical protein C8T65DRAFT_828476 [Cerioporus squamosus]|nr:hypothetical protein C8T65DRAFT_828476 [Cerioporus squamosus]